MMTLLPALAALAALCIWLTIKFVDRRGDIDWEYWTTAMIGLAILLVAASPVVCLFLAYLWLFAWGKNFWS